jgi:uncharacterized membrane protein
METNLRPMSLGEILDRTAQLYRENFVLFAGIFAAYAGVMLVLNLLQVGLQDWLRAEHMTKFLTLAAGGYLVITLPLVFICSGAAMAASNRAVAWVNLGEPATIRGAYASILPRLGRYLWIMTIATFVAYIPLVVIYGAVIVLATLTLGSKGTLANPNSQTSVFATILVGIALVGLLLLTFPAIIYAVWMAIRYSLAVPASVVENLKARKALRRSVELTKGSRGRIFVLGLLIAVIDIGLVGITQLFFIVAMFKAAKNHGQVPVWMQVAQQIMGFLTNSFIGPMFATGLTLFYYDQRIRKEGFDIEWMMQAAGLTPPAPETPADHLPAQDAHFETLPSAVGGQPPAAPDLEARHE